MQRISFDILILFLIPLILFYSCKKERELVNKIGSIHKIQNVVYYKNFKALVWEDAKENASLFKGDYIRTGSASLAVIKIGEKLINIEENTLIKIEDRKIQEGVDVSVELVLINGDISVEEGTKDLSGISVSRIRGSKREQIEISDLLRRIAPVPDMPDIVVSPQNIKLIYPCNEEKVLKQDLVMKWDREITGSLRIYDTDDNVYEYILISERIKKVDLNDGAYSWGLYSGEDLISNRCSFVVRAEIGSTKSVIVSKGRRRRFEQTRLHNKSEMDLPEVRKEGTSKQDIARARLVNIQSIITKNIEEIAYAKKSIDASGTKNYVEIYNKLDELNSLLMELKVLQESLFVEIVKLESPIKISSYLNELYEVEQNLKDISCEIKSIEREIFQQKGK